MAYSDAGFPLSRIPQPQLRWTGLATNPDISPRPWASFVIGTPAGTIYAVGDSGLGDGGTFRSVAQAHPGVRLALLPIGAYEPRWFMQTQHMNPEDSVAAFELCGAAQALGHHWGTFQLTTEAHDAPPAALAEALAARGIAPERFVAMRPGQVVDV